MRLKTNEMILVALFAGLMVVGAYVKFPIPWLPVTFQGFFCAMAGIILGARLGFMSQIVYITMGLIGLPVFSSGGGIGYIFNPTFGYILGFAAATFVIGTVSRKLGNDSLLKNLAALYAGLIIIYALGLSYSYGILTIYLGKPNVSIVTVAIAPYFIKDIILFTVVGMLAQRIGHLVKYAVRLQIR